MGLLLSLVITSCLGRFCKKIRYSPHDIVMNLCYDSKKTSKTTWEQSLQIVITMISFVTKTGHHARYVESSGGNEM